MVHSPLTEERSMPRKLERNNRIKAVMYTGGQTCKSPVCKAWFVFILAKDGGREGKRSADAAC